MPGRSLQLSLVLLLAAASAWAEAPCVSSKLSRSEAQQLLLQLPEVLAIQQAGGKVEVLEWQSNVSFGRSDIFYYFALQRPKLETRPLENGLIGHFAINVYSARVVRIDGGAEAAGDALAKAQAQLRTRHCISAQLVQENAEIAP